MTRDNKYWMIVVFVIIPFLFTAQSKKSPQLIIQLSHLINDEVLVLDDSVYINALNQDFTISKFNYYIGKIKLIKSNGESTLIPGYHFISEEKKTTKTIGLNKIAGGSYNELEFIIGVDSIDNCSGAQSGDLDPINGMFWTWNTGYIFLKLEGNSESSSAVGNTLEYHIGGYKQPNNSIRSIHLKFEKPLVIEKKTTQKIELNVIIDQLLSHPEAIDFSKNPVLNTPTQAKPIAGNYQYLFELNKRQEDVK